MKHFRGTLVNIRDHGSGLKSFQFSLPKDLSWNPLPGQCVSVMMPQKNQTKPRIRPYTLASSPQEKDYLWLIADQVPGGITSTWLHQLKVGDLVDFQGSYGRFFLIRPLAPEIFFLCHGSGIAPFRSMIFDLLAQKVNQSLMLYFENTLGTQIPWDDEFLKLSQEHKNFNYIPLIAKSPSTEPDQGSLKQTVCSQINSSENRHVYICGLKSMIQPLRAHLESIGFNRETLRTEAYD